jgi:hypothetical protein
MKEKSSTQEKYVEGQTVTIFLCNLVVTNNDKPTSCLIIHSFMVSTGRHRILRSGKKSHQNPMYMYDQPDGPEILVNPNDRIPCLTGLNIEPSVP